MPLRGWTSGSGGSSPQASLTTRGGWKRAVFRLVDTSEEDDALVEHDSDTVQLEGLLLALQVGLDNAQEYLLRAGLGGWWIKRSAAITSWNGTDDDDGGRYTDLPSDFRRLAGSHRLSPLVRANGERWGSLVEYDQRYMTGDGFYLRENDLWLLRGAAPPSPVYIEYVERLTVPVSDEASFSRMPRWALPLIPAYAAEYLMDEAFLPGGPELEAKIARRVFNLERRAVHQLRLSQGPRRIKHAPVVGNRFWS